MIASEFRIGNLIQYEQIVKPICEIDMLREYEDLVECVTLPEKDSEGRVWTYSKKWIVDCEPIEITEEWLLRFGFNKIAGKVSVFEKSRLRLVLGYGGCMCYLIDEDNTNGYYIPNGGIKYIHQLQNLFFAFTSTELQEPELNTIL